MIFIKLLLLLPVVFLIVSCAQELPPSPFEPGVTFGATFTCGEKSWNVEILTGEDEVLTVFVKDFPGYSITFSKSGVTTSFAGIEFSGSSDLFSLFSPIYQMYKDSLEKSSETRFNYSKNNALESIVHSSGCVIKDIK